MLGSRELKQLKSLADTAYQVYRTGVESKAQAGFKMQENFDAMPGYAQIGWINFANAIKNNREISPADAWQQYLESSRALFLADRKITEDPRDSFTNLKDHQQTALQSAMRAVLGAMQGIAAEPADSAETLSPPPRSPRA